MSQTLENVALERAQEWANNSYFSADSRREIQQLIDNKNTKEIVDRFYKDLEFGTGGLRSIIGMGSNRMSSYTVRRATEAMAQVMKKSFQNEVQQGKTLRVAISYDSRHFSREFALEAASVLLAHGIETFVFSRLNPTPLLSFAVRYQKAHAGIMITASHNPPAYNGYKAYWQSGGQVIPPQDDEIIEAYNNIKDFSSIRTVSIEQGEAEGLFHWMGEDIEKVYREKALSHMLNLALCKKNGGNLSIVFTPIHGTGHIPVRDLLAAMGFSKVHTIKEQAEPDANFSTVKSPNPENAEALSLAVQKMKELKADIVFGTDPDADRMGIVVNHQGKEFYLNGNQVGILLLNYILTMKSQQGNLPKNAVVMKSIVTSEMQTAVCEHFGLNIKNTLTGFKWMGGLLEELRAENLSLPFAFASEESYGYLVNDEVRDKDAISGVAMAAEMALFYKEQGKTLVDVLNGLYKQHGFFDEKLLSLDFEGKEGADKINRIMDIFRHSNDKTLAGTAIVSREDYSTLKRKNFKNGFEESLDLKYKSNVLGFLLECGSKVFLRPSGTEPKIKFYFMIRENQGTLENKRAVAEKKAGLLREFFKDKAMKA